MYRWVQVPVSRIQEMIKWGIVPKNVLIFGREIKAPYCDNKEKKMEFHIDIHEAFLAFILKNGQEFGGDLAFDFPFCMKPVMLIGQDESSIDSNLANNGTWVDNEGKGSIRPKGRGHGMMISAFVSREFGFGLGLTEEELVAVNRHRNNDAYAVPMCADLLGINKMKRFSNLLCDRSVEYFNFGGATGYWRSQHMAIQYEDLLDQIIAIPRFNHFRCIFLFDWSSGHAKALDDGLKAADMNTDYGGAQRKMRKSVLCKDSI